MRRFPVDATLSPSLPLCDEYGIWLNSLSDSQKGGNFPIEARKWFARQEQR